MKKHALIPVLATVTALCQADTIIQVRHLDIPIEAIVNTATAANEFDTMFFDQIDPSQYRIDSLALGIDSVSGGIGLALNLTSNPINYSQLAVLTNRLTSPGGTGSPAVTGSWVENVNVPGFFGSTTFPLPQRNLTGPVVSINPSEFSLFQGTGQVAVAARTSLTTSTIGTTRIAGTVTYTTNRVTGMLYAIVTPVPEPATIGAMGLGIAFLARLRHKKAKAGGQP